MSVDKFNRWFYVGFDPALLYHKAQALSYVLDTPSSYWQWYREHEQQENPWPWNPTHQFTQSLQAELYFTAIHQFEAFLAIIIAIFQPLPHWVYLTTYKPGDMKTAANQLLGRQLRELTNNHTDDKRQFIMTSIYSDMVSDDEQARARWDENLDNAFWLIESMARYYLDGLDAYNSYKHGVRFVPGTIDKWTNIGLERVADHGVAYLKLDNGQIIEISREIYPDESVYFLSVMYQMQETIRETRLYGWLHDLPPKDDSKIHSFLDIPREQIVAWAQKQESKQIR